MATCGRSTWATPPKYDIFERNHTAEQGRGMKSASFLFTSESVTEGHPDKVCDQISDGILDAILEQDKHGRVACESFITVGLVVVGGEITTKGYVDIQKVVRGILKEIGYIDAHLGFSSEGCAVLNAIGSQSPDIAQGVDTG